MNNRLKIAGVLTLSAILAACGSTPEKKDLNADVPEWILNPVIEDGIAASTCVPASGDMSIDSAQATAQGRADLAQQISTRVKAMDKTFQERVDVDGKIASGKTFSSVSKQLSNQILVGARPTKRAYAEFNGKTNFCVLTTMGSSSTKELFDKILNESERDISIDQEKVLYQEFKAQKAQEELEAEFDKNKN